MNAPTTTDKIATTAPPALWRVAEAFLHILFALFGTPSEVAERYAFRLREHQLMASWLRTGEAMMRRLLIIEAAAFAKPNTRPLLRAPRISARKRKLCSSDQPDSWPVRFHCNAPPALRPPSQRQPKLDCPRKPSKRADRWSHEHFAAPRFRDSWPLALRLEALLRVFNDPLSFARRLARRLYARPHLVKAIVRAAPREAADRVDHFQSFGDLAEDRGLVFNTS